DPRMGRGSQKRRSGNGRLPQTNRLGYTKRQTRFGAYHSPHQDGLDRANLAKSEATYAGLPRADRLGRGRLSGTDFHPNGERVPEVGRFCADHWFQILFGPAFFGSLVVATGYICTFERARIVLSGLIRFLHAL